MSILTDTERAVLVNEWHSLVPDNDAKMKYGEVLLLELFKQHPDYLKLFSSFKDCKTLEEVAVKPVFKAHCLRFMNAMCKVMDALDDTQTLVQILDQLAISHAKKNVTLNNFKSAFAIALQVITPLLQEEVSRRALDKVFQTAIPVIAKTY